MQLEICQSSKECTKASSQTIPFEAVLCPPDQQISLRLVVPKKQLTLSYLLPLARYIGGQIVSHARQGRSVTCRKGCAACCSYLVPLSVPELIGLVQDLHKLPPKLCHQAQVRFNKAAEAIIHSSSPEQLLDDDPGRDSLASLSQWYGSLQLPCPLLVASSCSMYAQRPMSCREYMATSSPSLCQPESSLQASKISVPLNMSYALALTAAKLEGTAAESVLLPLALHWADLNADRARQTFPAVSMVRQLVSTIQELLAQ